MLLARYGLALFLLGRISNQVRLVLVACFLVVLLAEADFALAPMRLPATVRLRGAAFFLAAVLRDFAATLRRGFTLAASFT